MKKMLMTLMCMVAGFVWADDNMTIFLDTNADFYADGNPVMDGEYYALVWVRTGVTFAGFRADCSLVNAPEDAHLFMAAPWAQDGYAESRSFMLRKSQYQDYLGKGTWNIYVLDTRVVTGMDAQGKPIYGLAPESAAGLPTAVNGWGLVAALEVVSSYGQLGATCDLFESETDVKLKGEDVAELPEGDGGRPSVSGIFVKDGVVSLKVANTVSYVQYDVARGNTPSAAGDERYVAREVKSGDPAKEIVLEVPVNAADKAKFFRIIRHVPSQRTAK